MNSKNKKISTPQKVGVGVNTAVGTAVGAIVGKGVHNLKSLSDQTKLHTLQRQAAHTVDIAKKVNANPNAVHAELTAIKNRAQKIIKSNKRFGIIAPIAGAAVVGGISGVEAYRQYKENNKKKNKHESVEIMRHPHVINADYETIKSVVNKTPKNWKIPAAIGAGAIVATGAGIAAYKHNKDKKESISDYIKNYPI